MKSDYKDRHCETCGKNMTLHAKILISIARLQGKKFVNTGRYADDTRGKRHIFCGDPCMTEFVEREADKFDRH